MSEIRPRLVAVEEPSTPETPAPEGAPVPARRGGSSLLTFAFALAFAVCAVGWIAAQQRLDRAEGQLAERTAELGAARAELSTARGRINAFEGHVSTARERVGALLGELGALEAFLAADPADAGEDVAP